jgi:hypothetical protein
MKDTSSGECGYVEFCDYSRTGEEHGKGYGQF